MGTLCQTADGMYLVLECNAFSYKIEKKSYLKILDICVIDKTLLSSVN